MNTMVSADGTKRVRPVVIDGKSRLYVETKSPRGWIFTAETTSIAEVGQHVDITTLVPAV